MELEVIHCSLSYIGALSDSQDYLLAMAIGLLRDSQFGLFQGSPRDINPEESDTAPATSLLVCVLESRILYPERYCGTLAGFNGVLHHAV